MNISINFKDPDALWMLSLHHCPGEYADKKVEMAREKFLRDYTEHGDYGVFEINPVTLEGRLVKRK